MIKRRIKIKKVLILVLMIFSIGCAKKYVKVPEEPIRVEKEIDVQEIGVQREKAKEAEVVREKILTAEKPKETTLIEAKEAIKESLFEFKDALFDFDRYNIRPDARDVLDSTAEWLKKNKNINILIEGHCDDRGTNEYNLALGEKRAKAAKDYLVSLGVASVRINTISYGEEKPLCTEQVEDCWQRNRRAHFVIAQ